MSNKSNVLLKFPFNVKTSSVCMEDFIELKVQERTEVLEQELKSRDEFLSIASHELKNPLSTLLLQITSMGRGLENLFKRELENSVEGLPSLNPVLEKLLKSLASCERQTKRLAVMVDQLLDVTAVQDGKLELRKEPMDLTWFVTEFIERNRTEGGAKPEIGFYCKEGSVIGIWDSYRLEQVINNLVTNALKYGEGKPIDISIEKDTEKNIARFSIRDYGIGIPLEMQEQIFNKFERGKNCQNLPGLGLGLYIVQKIVAAHGGNIFLQSVVGKGSTFTVELPLGVLDFSTSLCSYMAI